MSNAPYAPYAPPPPARRPHDPHCAACPLAAHVRCPSDLHPSWCKNAAKERKQPDPRQHVWLEKIRAKAEAIAGQPVALRVPAGFPAAHGTGDGRIRAGIIVPDLYVGGAEVWTDTLARTADASRIAWMGCATLGGHDASIPEMIGRIADSMPVAHGNEAIGRLIAACDVLVTWAIDDLGGRLAALDAGHARPRVISVAHSVAACAHARKVYARSTGIDRWAAVSEYAREAIPEARRADAVILGNCVDSGRLAPTRDRAAMHATWGVPPGAIVAGYYGRMSPEKRPEVMAEVARHLPRPWHVVVVGPDYGPPTLRDAAKGLANLHLVGPDARAGDVLRAFDVMVAPSDFESWGLSIAEAIEVGTPVVSTPVGIAGLTPGLTRLVGHGATGPEWAAACLASVWDGRPAGQMALIRAARAGWTQERFGRVWSDFIVETAGGRP